MTGQEIWKSARDKYRQRLRAIISGHPLNGDPMTPDEARKALEAFERKYPSGNFKQ